MDPRLFRFDHVVCAMALLSGFVFDVPEVIPLCALLMAAAGAFPGLAPTHRLAGAVVLARLPLRAAPTLDDPAPWRSAAFVAAGVLGVATLAGDGSLGWMLALAVAITSALAGVANVCLGCRVRLPGS